MGVLAIGKHHKLQQRLLIGRSVNGITEFRAPSKPVAFPGAVPLRTFLAVSSQ